MKFRLWDFAELQQNEQCVIVMRFRLWDFAEVRQNEQCASVMKFRLWDFAEVRQNERFNQSEPKADQTPLTLKSEL